MRIIRNIHYLLISAITIAGLGCSTPTDPEPIEQGLRGEVIFWEGNFMPTYPVPSKGGTKTPVSRTIHIYEPTSIRDVDYKGVGPFIRNIHTTRVTTTRSNNNGLFEVYLSPGQYSVFFVEKDGYYATGSDGQGYLSTVTIKPDTVIERRYNITHGASF